MFRRLLTLGLTLCAGLSLADTLTTTGGDVLQGTVKGIKGGKVTFETALFGTLVVPRENIAKLECAADEGKVLLARTDPKTEAKDEVRVGRDAEGNTVLIPTRDKAKALALADVATLWAPDETDPDFPPPPPPPPEPKRWAYSASLGFTGGSDKGGNNISMSAYIDAVRTGENTTFKTYASMNKIRSDGERTAERYIGGLDFEHRPSDYCTWYVRDEAQHNRFSDYKLRNVLGAGYGLYFWNTKTEGRTSLLRFRLGLAHTYVEHYTHKWPNSASEDRVKDSDMALDLGLLFHYDFVCGVSWNTELTYTPLFDDLDKGTLVHESKLSYLMQELGMVNEKLSDISLEAGIRNEYQTRPEPGNCHTDTTWYLRLKKSW